MRFCFLTDGRTDAFLFFASRAAVRDSVCLLRGLPRVFCWRAHDRRTFGAWFRSAGAPWHRHGLQPFAPCSPRQTATPLGRLSPGCRPDPRSPLRFFGCSGRCGSNPMRHVTGMDCSHSHQDRPTLFLRRGGGCCRGYPRRDPAICVVEKGWGNR